MSNPLSKGRGVNEFDEGGNDNHLSIVSVDVSSNQRNTVSLPKKLVNTITKDIRLTIEVVLSIAFICIAFILSFQKFSNQSLESLVPQSSAGQCSSVSELYSLPSQHVQLSYPLVIKFVSYTGGRTLPYDSFGEISAQWYSCSKEGSNLNEFGFAYGIQNISYLPISLPAEDIGYFELNSTITLMDDCFKMVCGFTFNPTGIDKPLNDYVNNTVISILPYTAENAVENENGTLTIINSQIWSSIVSTDDSVSGSCGLSLAGTLYNVLTTSNSIVNSGTYLCTTKTDTSQAISSSLSVALTVFGICRMYFIVKNFIYS